MAKQIYCTNLKNRMGVAESEEGIFEELKTLYHEGLTRDDVEISVAVSEEVTKKMLLLHRVMYRSEAFEYLEIFNAIMTLVPAECKGSEEEIADAVCTTGERLADMDEEEFMDWFVTE